MKNREKVDGFLLFDKPLGMTSNFALQKLKRLLNAQKAGHIGTLDPMASGLLPVAFGQATKYMQDLFLFTKRYSASLCLGVRTTTGDREGQVISTQPVHIGAEQMGHVLESFKGEIEQVPPMLSALKKNGRPLYELARSGIEISREPRKITITALEVISFEGNILTLDVECSKGTYIRTLAEDIGAALGCGAHLCALRRTAVGSLSVLDAVSMTALEARPPQVDRLFLKPVDSLLGGLKAMEFDAQTAERLKNGQRIKLGTESPQGCEVRIYGPSGEFLGTGLISAERVLSPWRMMAV